MAFVNMPVFLDSSGKELVKELQRECRSLAIIAEQGRQQTISDINLLKKAIRSGTVESNRELFPVGDQIIVPWRDMYDYDHNTLETAYRMPFNIVHHGMVELESGEKVPGMFLQTDYSIYTFPGLHMMPAKSFMHTVDTLSSGNNYYFRYEDPDNPSVNRDWNFTPSREIPPGLEFACYYYKIANADPKIRIIVYDHQIQYSWFDAHSVPIGAGVGNYLGKLSKSNDCSNNFNKELAANMNDNVYPMSYSNSEYNMYLNNYEDKWFHNSLEFSVPTNTGEGNQQAPRYSFAQGFDQEFFNAIPRIKIITNDVIKNDVTYCKFFVPSASQMNIESPWDNEGETFEYWKKFLRSETPIGKSYANPDLVLNTFNYESKLRQYQNTIIITRSMESDKLPTEDGGLVGLAAYSYWEPNGVKYESISHFPSVQTSTRPCCCIC